MTGRRIERVQNAIAIGIVVGHVSIVADIICRRECFDRVGNTIVVAVQVQEVFDAVVITVNRRDASVGGDWDSIGIHLSAGTGCVVVNSVSIGVHDRCVGAAFFKVADAVVVTVQIAVVGDAVSIGVSFLGHVNGKAS